MAITACHFDFYRHLLEMGALPQQGVVMEIGQAEWYGDQNPLALRELCELVPDQPRRLKLLERFKTIITSKEGKLQYRDRSGSFDLVGLFYEYFLQLRGIVTIDPHGDERALKNIDLNYGRLEKPPQTPMDVVINNGTIEHIFNIANVFRLMHDYCGLGGLMLHDAPLTGWFDHGFYTLQPTLYFDLAQQNQYDIVAMWVCAIEPKTCQPVESREHMIDLARKGLPDNAMLLVALRKTGESAFRCAIQGVYAGTVTKQVYQAWRELR
jgi:hypothetical protein